MDASGVTSRFSGAHETRAIERPPRVQKVQHTSQVGRAITAAFPEHSTVASEVTRVVLDSPKLHLRGTVECGAQQAKRPFVGSSLTSAVRVAEGRDSHPQLVTLVRVNGAGHVEAGNTDPQGYQRRLTDSLSSP